MDLKEWALKADYEGGIAEALLGYGLKMPEGLDGEELELFTALYAKIEELRPLLDAVSLLIEDLYGGDEEDW